MSTVIGTSNLNNKIYQLTGSPLQWSDFPTQPPGARVGYGIWGGPGNTIWTHNGRSDSQKRFLFFDGGSWSEYTQGDDIPGGYYDPVTIYGSEDGQYVYAGSENAVQRWNGGPSWTTVVTGWAAGAIWCDATGQHVWATQAGLGNPQNHIYVSSNYGASWTNIVFGLIDVIDAYMVANGHPGSVGGWSGTPRGISCTGIWGVSPTEIYLGAGFDNSDLWSPGGIVVAKWNGSTWSVVSANIGGAGSLESGAQHTIWTDGVDYVVGGRDSGTNAIIFKDNAGFLQRQVDSTTWGHILKQTNGRNVSEFDGGFVLAINGYFSAGPAHCVITDDGLATWTETNKPWGSSEIGIDELTLFGWVTQVPPVLRNQDPAPDSSGHPSDVGVYLEVYDENGDLTLSSVDIYLDGTLAWTSGAPTGDHSGRTRPVSDAQGYWLYAWDDWDPGAHTVRVVAQDDLGNPLDETYSFSTVASTARICGRVQWGAFQWGGSKL